MEGNGWHPQSLPTLVGQYRPSPEVHQDGEDGDLGPVVEGTVQYAFRR